MTEDQVSNEVLFLFLNNIYYLCKSKKIILGNECNLHTNAYTNILNHCKYN